MAPSASPCSQSRWVADPPISGRVASGWESVRDVFAQNLRPSEGDPGDLGAGVCVIVDGRVVVDLVGGWRDRAMRLPFADDTLVNVYSVGKGVTSVIALAAASQGLIDLDQPVNRHWSSFPQDSTLRQHLTHQAGLPALRGEIADEVPTDWSRMCATLATTEPWWEPGTAHGYHVNTAGFLVGEPVRIAAGRERFGHLLHDWLAEPLGADLVYGVPDRDLSRCSEIEFGGAAPSRPQSPENPSTFDDELARMRHHAYFNPSTVSGMHIVETPAWRQAEVPSTNLHATARAVATVYAATLDPRGPVDPAVLAEARTTQVDGEDLILGKRSRFGLGFQLHQDDRPVGVSPESFGHFGFGGSIGFADPGVGIAAAYVLNRPGDRWQIPRTKRLLATLRDIV